jgi:hypothetical protein
LTKVTDMMKRKTFINPQKVWFGVYLHHMKTGKRINFWEPGYRKKPLIWIRVVKAYQKFQYSFHFRHLSLEIKKCFKTFSIYKEGCKHRLYHLLAVWHWVFYLSLPSELELLNEHNAHHYFSKRFRKLGSVMQAFYPSYLVIQDKEDDSLRAAQAKSY